MATEIERKFLVRGDAWRVSPGVVYRQGYLSRVPERTVRVRVAGEKAYLAVKGVGQGLARPEYEYEIPFADGVELLETLAEKPLVEKKRHQVCVDGFVWAVDEFFGENSGLVLAEIELQSEDQNFSRPPWLGEEVTGDSRYFNAMLGGRPFTKRS